MLETEIVLVPKHYGIHYHRFAVNAQFVTLIPGLPMNKLSPRSGKVQSCPETTSFTFTKKDIILSKKIENHI